MAGIRSTFFSARGLHSGMRTAVLILTLFFLPGCEGIGLEPHATSPPPSVGELRIAPGDLFELRVADEPTLSASYLVGDDGTIRFPLIGSVQVEGVTISQLEEELTKRLADGYLRNPQVLVVMKDSRSKKVTVLGQVVRPGTFPYTQGMSIGEAISLSGGFTTLARKNRVLVTRERDGKQDKIYVAVQDIARGKAPNFYLRPGDAVYVDESLF